MARTGDQYKKLLLSLLPPGKMWTRDENSLLSKILHAAADYMARVEDRAENLILERDSRTASELLSEHEDDYGLPEIGESIAESDADRQIDLHAAVLRVGQINNQYYVDIADAFGYDVEIEEYQPFYAGFSTAGAECGRARNLFIFTVLIDHDSIEYSKEFNLTKLISRINAVRPGHTHVQFQIVGPAFSRGFSRGFDAINHYDNSWPTLGFGRGFSNGFANAYDYDGVNLVGGFSQGFSIGFDRQSGGGFNDGFSGAFSQQS